MIIDVTQLVHWGGKLTGIPRVMNELAIRYEGKEDVTFVSWNPEAKNYVQIELQSTLKQRGRKIQYSTPRRTLIPYGFMLRVLRRLRHYRIPVPGVCMRGLAYLGRPAKRFTFNKSDTLLVLWGEQGSRPFINELTQLHTKGVKIIQVVYDLLPLITPQYSGHSTDGMNNYTRKIVPKASLVLSISEHTKKDLTAWLKDRKLHVPQIEFFRLGDDFAISKEEKPKQATFKKSGLKGGDYLLTVGTIEARKNHTLLYYTYKLALARGIDLPKIVIVGRQGWMAGDVYSLMKHDPEVKEKFVVLESATDEQLVWLYKHALFTVYPSFYEGWGLPIAESIARGTPCLCSNTSSMPEVAGPLAVYFDPCSAEECLKAVTGMLQPKALKAEKTRIKAYKITTWDQTFEQVNSYIKEVS